MEATVQETQASNTLAALGTLAAIVQREDAMMREAAGARRAGIATVLGFNGVLIGLSIFAVGDACSGDGVMVDSGLLVFFAVATGLAMIVLTVAAVALLRALWKDGAALLDPDSLDKLDGYAVSLGAGDATNPIKTASESVRLLTREGMLLDEQRSIASRQAGPARVGLAGTGLGIGLLAGAGFIVVAEVLFG